MGQHLSEIQLIITLRKLTIKDHELEKKKIKLGVFNGEEIMWISYEKMIKKGLVKFYGQAFSFSSIPPIIEFQISYEIGSKHWRSLAEIKVSQTEIDSFSQKRNTHFSEAENVTLSWESQIHNQFQVDNTGTFLEGERNLEDFSDLELVSPQKKERRMQVYSPCFHNFQSKKETMELPIQNNFSQRKSNSRDKKIFTIQTTDTFLAHQKGTISGFRKKINGKVDISVKKLNSTQPSNVPLKRYISDQNVWNSGIHQRPASSSKQQLHRLNQRISPKSAFLAGLLGAVSGVSGALISFL